MYRVLSLKCMPDKVQDEAREIFKDFCFTKLSLRRASQKFPGLQDPDRIVTCPLVPSNGYCQRDVFFCGHLNGTVKEALETLQCTTADKYQIVNTMNSTKKIKTVAWSTCR